MIAAKPIIILSTIVLLAACATAPKPAAPPAQAPAPAARQTVSDDYFPQGVKLAAGRIESFMGDLYTVPFHTVTVVTAPGAATKGEGLVRLTKAAANPAEQEYWTPYIVDTRPAKDADLVVGASVFATGDDYGRSREDLAKSTEWGLRRVKDVSNLYKGILVLEYHDTYWNTWKEHSCHKNNVRIIEGAFSPEFRKP
jgi:hypothetical protein